MSIDDLLLLIVVVSVALWAVVGVAGPFPYPRFQARPYIRIGTPPPPPRKPAVARLAYPTVNGTLCAQIGGSGGGNAWHNRAGPKPKVQALPHAPGNPDKPLAMPGRSTMRFNRPDPGPTRPVWRYEPLPSDGTSHAWPDDWVRL